MISRRNGLYTVEVLNCRDNSMLQYLILLFLLEFISFCFLLIVQTLTYRLDSTHTHMYMCTRAHVHSNTHTSTPVRTYVRTFLTAAVTIAFVFPGLINRAATWKPYIYAYLSCYVFRFCAVSVHTISYALHYKIQYYTKSQYMT